MKNLKKKKKLIESKKGLMDKFVISNNQIQHKIQMKMSQISKKFSKKSQKIMKRYNCKITMMFNFVIQQILIINFKRI